MDMNLWDSNEFRCGRPNFSEWPSCWKLTPDEYEVDSEEFNTITNGFGNFLLEYYPRKNPNIVSGLQMYALGDEMGDRSQYLIINDPRCLNVVLLSRLQGWLQDFKNWRIVIPTLDTKPTHIVVYHDVVRMPDRYEDDEGLQRLRNEMLDYLKSTEN